MNEPTHVQPYEIPENTTPLSNPLGDVTEVDWTSPNIARMYDYFLGGSANFAVDREAAEQFLTAMPGNTQWAARYAQGNRSFLRRVLHTLCQRGIDQFLDLGSGVPTVGNVHEIAHAHNPHARVAYVDIEPVAVHHARHLLGDEPRVSVTQADIRQPQSVLHADGVAGLLDFDRPVGILAMGIVDLLADADDPCGIIAAYRDACCPGSALALSHAVQDAATDAQVQAFQEIMRRTNTAQLWFRTPGEVVGFLAGYELLEPGVVPFDHWRPESPVSNEQARQANGYGGAGILPQT